MDMGWSLSFSAKNCSVTITHLNPLSIITTKYGVYHAGYLRYTVEGTGEQTFNMHSPWNAPLKWDVKIDDVERMQGDGWDYSNDWVTVKNATSKVVLSAELLFPKVEPRFDAEMKPYFTSQDLNSTISFTSAITFMEPYTPNPNGTYTFPQQTTIYPDAIYFKTNSTNAQTIQPSAWWLIQNTNTGIRTISASNSNLTITAAKSTSQPLSTKGKWTTYRADWWLNYSVAGTGTQSTGINLPYDRRNMTVYIDGAARERGDGWQLGNQWQGQTWLTVTGATSSVSIHTWDTYASGPSLMFPEPDYILVWIALAIIAALLTIIGYSIKKRQKQKTSQQNQPDTKP